LKKLIIFSRDECKQFQMKQKITDERVRFFIGDVRDSSRLERAFNGVDIVVHAAALKHVPIVEYNPFEAVKTNIIGSRNVINASINQGVEKCLLISTDKAAEPCNLYGSTKLCAEKLFISGNSYASEKTIFSCVRYGNVLGSRGSIVETLLKNNLSEIPVTDPKMTRFWITLQQSFNLVLFALEHMQGGEIFIPKAPSMKLVDLFDALVPDTPQKIVGIRPGEKLHEILVTKEEARHTVGLDNYYIVLPEHTEIFDKEVRFANHLAKGQELENDFHFSSHTNSNWLTKSELRKLILNK